MATFKEEQIGARIKSLRIDRGLTLAAVSERTDLSRSYLSKLENSKSAPPVSTLAAIAEALGVHVADIFADAEPTTMVTVVKKNERHASYRYGIEAGYSYSPLAPVFPKRLMDPYLINILPSAEKAQVFQHKGHELMLILSGRLQLHVGEQKFLLEAGDCVYLDASIPHYGYALGDEQVEAMLVIAAGGGSPS
ncbi:MAG: XRE family transcriptional regulator [Desulfarculaceae bacterium]|nr:XRE family transcriptional regulator [Desulfarculaceae bacterium]MCF8047435.1 XRE family transcriptional regulator [Desulfarculaceae bacterium]MCF8065327.1 XRE family transcriptional regulator [Desulfarculaceae bacterium]MCF8098778.1 XRE family transcriptional regulator [Desulfarculaceae bacterium]MCF8122093.1 XRE family transcriptional regulator [Desulfarculaceae bacterium]